jgi:hypothetical protein
MLAPLSRPGAQISKALLPTLYGTLAFGVEQLQSPALASRSCSRGPEGNATCLRRWDRDCAEAGDVLVPDLAVAAAGLDCLL